MLYHLSGLEMALRYLGMRPECRAQLSSSTFNQLRSVRQLIDEEMLTRHPSSTSGDVFDSLDDCSPTPESVRYAFDHEQDGSLSCSKLGSDHTRMSEPSDGDRPLAPHFPHQLLNLSSDMVS